MLGGASASPTTENINNTSHQTAGTKRKKNKNDSSSSSKRFSDEQIKSLESLFKMENKLEPRKKLELARELGLHPRQVAIWFQNRRARWKSKQVEQDYTSLKADYDTLSDRFESLKKEKHDLLQQLSNLCSQLKDPYHVDSGSENSRGPLEQDMAIYSDEDDPCRNHNHNKDEEELDMPTVTDQVSDDKPCNFDLGSLFDQSCSNWWDVWPSNC